MGRAKEHSGFPSGFHQRTALVREWQGRFVGWRLWSPRMGRPGRTPLSWARVSGLPGKRPAK